MYIDTHPRVSLFKLAGNINPSDTSICKDIIGLYVTVTARRFTNVSCGVRMDNQHNNSVLLIVSDLPLMSMDKQTRLGEKIGESSLSAVC